MGLFSRFTEQLMSDKLDGNGLARGTNSECCERCQYRAKDPRSAYFVCGTRRMYVGANQVCDDFMRGEPIYTIS